MWFKEVRAKDPPVFSYIFDQLTDTQGFMGDENDRRRGIYGSMERKVRGRLHFIADGGPATHATCPVHVLYSHVHSIHC